MKEKVGAARKTMSAAKTTKHLKPVLSDRAGKPVSQGQGRKKARLTAVPDGKDRHQKVQPGEDARMTIGYWLGTNAVDSSKVESDFDVIEWGAQGVTKASIDDLTAHMGITRKVMAEELLGMSVKTLERKTPKEKLDQQVSSHAIEIAKIMQHAWEVFGDEEKLRRWMNRENRALNDLKPVLLLKTLTGINMVNDILGRIQEGIYS